MTAIVKIPAATAAFTPNGAFSTTMSISNCGLMIGVAILGLFFAFAELPSAPFILGFILGPMLEMNLRKGITYDDRGFIVFLTRPISCALLLVAVGSMFWPYIRARLEAKKGSKYQDGEDD